MGCLFVCAIAEFWTQLDVRNYLKFSSAFSWFLGWAISWHLWSYQWQSSSFCRVFSIFADMYSMKPSFGRYPCVIVLLSARAHRLVWRLSRTILLVQSCYPWVSIFLPLSGRSNSSFRWFYTWISHWTFRVPRSSFRDRRWRCLFRRSKPLFLNANGPTVHLSWVPRSALFPDTSSYFSAPRPAWVHHQTLSASWIFGWWLHYTWVRESQHSSSNWWCCFQLIVGIA